VYVCDVVSVSRPRNRWSSGRKRRLMPPQPSSRFRAWSRIPARITKKPKKMLTSPPPPLPPPLPYLTVYGSSPLHVTYAPTYLPPMLGSLSVTTTSLTPSLALFEYLARLHSAYVALVRTNSLHLLLRFSRLWNVFARPWIAAGLCSGMEWDGT
jgi:hypothetical protein